MFSGQGILICFRLVLQIHYCKLLLLTGSRTSVGIFDNSSFIFQNAPEAAPLKCSSKQSFFGQALKDSEENTLSGSVLLELMAFISSFTEENRIISRGRPRKEKPQQTSLQPTKKTQEQ